MARPEVAAILVIALGDPTAGVSRPLEGEHKMAGCHSVLFWGYRGPRSRDRRRRVRALPRRGSTSATPQAVADRQDLQAIVTLGAGRTLQLAMLCRYIVKY